MCITADPEGLQICVNISNKTLQVAGTTLRPLFLPYKPMREIGHDVNSTPQDRPVMNRDTRTFFFSVVSIFTFLFLEWTYIIGKSHDQSHDMSHDHRGKVVHRPSRIGISSVLKSSGNSNEFSLSTLIKSVRLTLTLT